MAAQMSRVIDIMGWCAIFMLGSFPISVMIGTVLGILAGLGTGGGSLLILWLTFVLQVDDQVARSINLLFYIPSALIACLFRWKQGAINLRSILPAIIAGCVCAGVFSYVSTMLGVQLLRKLFGLLLIFIGVRELFYRPRKAR